MSSLAIEVAILGRTEGAGDAWCQWFPDEGGRADLDMVNVTQETFPLGMAIDLTSTKTFPKGQSMFLFFLLVMTHHDIRG